MKVMSEDKQGESRGPSRIPVPTSKRGLKGFLEETILEMKKVTWPTKKEATRLSGVVITVCTGSVLLLYGLSIAFHEIMLLIVGKGSK